MKNYVPRLYTKYSEEIYPAMKKDFGYKNHHQVPKLLKICINQGIGKFATDRKTQETFQNELTQITGQKAMLSKSKMDVSNFKLRKGMPVGVTVTLRRVGMYEFLDRLISTSIPRIRDFRGLNTRAFDANGNYNLGITEQIIFPEIDIDKIKTIQGLNITFVTSTNSVKESRALLTYLGMPFKSS